MVSVVRRPNGAVMYTAIELVTMLRRARLLAIAAPPPRCFTERRLAVGLITEGRLLKWRLQSRIYLSAKHVVLAERGRRVRSRLWGTISLARKGTSRRRTTFVGGCSPEVFCCQNFLTCYDYRGAISVSWTVENDVYLFMFILEQILWERTDTLVQKRTSFLLKEQDPTVRQLQS